MFETRLQPLVILGATVFFGCGDDNERDPKPPPKGDALVNATTIDYEDTEAFDGLLEAALNARHETIVINTKRSGAD